MLDEKVAEGAITVPHGLKERIKGISITQASHPVPDRAGVVGTEKILNILGKVRENDLVFVLISGGGSALLPLPAAGVSLADKQSITNLLLRSGASIHEINSVRKHLSAVKGGQLLRHVDKSCNVVSLILSDVIGDDLDVIASGPTCPDRSTFADAQRILKKYRIKEPFAALDHIAKGTRGEVEETPKPRDPVFLRVHNVLVGNNEIACTTATSYLKKHGVKAEYLGSRFDGEARGFGMVLARLASDLGGRPFALVAGGETTVRLDRSKSGIGGRNQEAALACMMKLRRRDVVVACMGTDGIDGNSDAAGALVSPKTMSLAAGMDLKNYLDRHDSNSAFRKLRSLIITGYTGTNVNDVAIVCGAST
jgi:glycerate-2-kinase